MIDPRLEAEALEEMRQRGLQSEAIRQGLDAQQIFQAVYWSRQRPDAPPGVLVSSVKAGVEFSEFSDLADQGSYALDQARDEPDGATSFLDSLFRSPLTAASKVYEYGIKPALRSIFIAGDTAYKELIERPYGAASMAVRDGGEGVNYLEAYRDWGDSEGRTAFETLRDTAGDQGIGAAFQQLTTRDDEETPETDESFLGTGFFVGENTQVGRQYLEGIQDRGLVRGERASMGRLVADPLTSWKSTSNEDRAYDVMSGLLDFSYQVALDPLSAGTGGTRGLAQGAAAGADNMARLVGRADRASDWANRVEDALTIRGTTRARREARTFSDDPFIRQELGAGGSLGDLDAAGQADLIKRSRGQAYAAELTQRLDEAEAAGRPADDVLTEMTGLVNSRGRGHRGVLYRQARAFTRRKDITEVLADPEMTPIKVLNGFSRNSEVVPDLDLIVKLGDATDEETVVKLLTEAIGDGRIASRNFYSGFSSRVNTALGNKRFAGIAPNGVVSAASPEMAVAKLDSMLRQANVGNSNILGKVDDAGMQYREDVLRRVAAIDPKDPFGDAKMFTIVRDVSGRVADSLAAVDEGMGSVFIREVTSLYDEFLREFRSYHTDEMANELVTPHSRVKVAREGEVIVGGPHMLTQLNKDAIPLPDVQDIRRAAERWDWKRKVYQSTGWDRFERGASWFTSNVFKPAVLLRPAYISRTTMDDHLRMSAAGFESLFTSPREYLSALATRPEETLTLIGNKVVDQRQAAMVLNHSLVNDLNLANGGQGSSSLRRAYARLTAPPKGAAPEDYTRDYLRASRRWLGLHANDPISQRLIHEDFDIDAVVKAIRGRTVTNAAEADRIALAARSRVMRDVGNQFQDTERLAERMSSLSPEDVAERLGVEVSSQAMNEGTFSDIVRTRMVVSELLDEVDLEGVPAGFREEMENTLALQFQAWTEGRSQDAARLLGDETLPDDVPRGMMHFMREQGLLGEMADAAPRWARRTPGAAEQPALLRAESVPLDQFREWFEEGVLSPGEYFDVSRLSSATTSTETAARFLPDGLDDARPVLFVYDEGTRALDMSWAGGSRWSGEREVLLPSQRMVVEEVNLNYFDRSASEHMDDYLAEAYDPDYLSGEPDWFPDEDMFEEDVLDARSVVVRLRPADDSVPLAQRIVEEGRQDWMYGLDRVDSLDTLRAALPSDGAADTRAIKDLWGALESARRGVEGDLANHQLHGLLRTMVDAAPPSTNRVYTSVDREQFRVLHDEALDPDDIQDLLGRQVDVGKGSIQSPDGVDIPRRMVRTTAGDEVENVLSDLGYDKPVVMEFPPGTPSLTVGDNVGLAPRMKARVISIADRGDRYTLQMQVDTHPGKGRTPPRAGGDGPLGEYLATYVNGSQELGAQRLLTDDDALATHLETLRDSILMRTGGREDILRLIAGDRIDGLDFFDKNQNEAIETWLAHRGDDLPPAVMGAKELVGDEAQKTASLKDILADRIITRPSNYLSRSPMFQQSMTKSTMELFPLMTPGVRREALEAAKENLRLTSAQREALDERFARWKDYDGPGTIETLKDADELVVERAVREVSDTLFDVQNRSAFQDAFGNIFPFVDAWREGLEVWSRTLLRNPAWFARQRAVFQGAEDTGFIYTNERGERVFANPGSTFLVEFVERMSENNGNLLTDNIVTDAAGAALTAGAAMMGNDERVGDTSGVMETRLEGMNMLFSSIGPGVGPLVQWPLGAFAPDNPAFDGFQELVNPYGNSFENPSEFGDVGSWFEAIAPAWAGKVFNAITAGEIDEVQWSSILNDQMDALVYSGRYDPTSRADVARLEEDAKTSARWMLAIRGIVQGSFVAGPEVQMTLRTDGVNPDFEPDPAWDPEADPDGTWHQLGALASEYYRLLDGSGGDFDYASEKFREAYGTEPAYLAQAKTMKMTSLEATDEAETWALRNSNFFGRFPTVAGYFAPAGEGEESNYRVWREQIARGERELVSPAERVALANAALARQQYYSAKRQLEDAGVTGSVMEGALAGLKAVIEDEFPGWEAAAGPIDRPSTDVQIEQLEAALQDPAAQTSPAYPSLVRYMDARRGFLEMMRSSSGSPNATLARQDAQVARQALRQAGTLLSQQDPNFAGMWTLLRREVDE